MLTMNCIKRARSYYTDECAAISIEFAIMTPIMIVILLASMEVTRALDFQRRSENVARSIADLTAQGDTKGAMSAASVDDIIASSRLIAAPFDTSTLSVVISAMGVDTKKNGNVPNVCSSYSTANASARAVGKASSLIVPPGYTADKMRYVYVEMAIKYKPFFSSKILGILQVFTGDISFNINTAWTVRGGKFYSDNPYREIVLPNGKSC